jgi:ketosteroid isomerase-like protein
MAMSQENVKVVRAAIDAMNRRDFDGLSRCLTADAEYDFTRAIGLQQGVYDRARLRGFWDEIMDPWESVRIELDRIVEADDKVVARQTTYFRGRGGIEVSNRVAQVWTIRGGLIAHCCLYQDEREALEAVGRSDQDAHANP